MADTKLSALTALTTPAEGDLFHIGDVSAGDDKKIPHSDLCISGAFPTAPIIAGSNVAGVQTYNAQQGYFSKIGNICAFNLVINLSAVDGAIDGTLSIKNLPYICGSGHTPVIVGAHSGWSSLSANSEIVAYIFANTSGIVLEQTDGNTKTTLTDAQLSGDEYITLSGSYITA